jgi:hypothetical protein
MAVRNRLVTIEPPPGTPHLSLDTNPMLALGHAGAKAELAERPTVERRSVGWAMCDGGAIRVSALSIIIAKMSPLAVEAAVQRVILEGWTTVAIRGHEEGRVPAAVALHRHGIDNEDEDLRAQAAEEVQRQRKVDKTRQEATRKAAEKRKADEASQAACDTEAARLAARADEKQRAAEKQEADQAAKALRDAEAVRLAAKAAEERRVEEMRLAEQVRLPAAAPRQDSEVAASAPTRAPKKRPPGLAR